MAIGDNYISTQDLADYMTIQGASYDARITSVCSAVSREIEDFCHRQFNQASAASARVFRPTDRDTVYVDDFLTTVGLIVKTDDNCDGTFSTTWDPADFEVRPLGGLRNGVDGWPFYEIGAVKSRRFHWARRGNVQITAQWGWSEVPAPVIESALMLAADTFQVKDSRFGVAGSDQFGNVTRVRDNVVATNKLNRYVRNKVYVA